MPDTPSTSAEKSTDGASCTVPPVGRADTRRPADSGLLSGGCCSGDSSWLESQAPMSQAARRSRALAGVAFLAVAGALSSRRLPGAIALWPASLVPTWFGISHLIAGVTGYQGCPELGAIPTVMLGRPVGSSCELWRRIDRWVDPSDSVSVSCC